MWLHQFFRLIAACNYWSNLGSVHQVPITAGWTEAVWNTKFAQLFYTWPALEIEPLDILILRPILYPFGHMLPQTNQTRVQPMTSESRIKLCSALDPAARQRLTVREAKFLQNVLDFFFMTVKSCKMHLNVRK